MLGLLIFINYIYHGDASDAAQGSTVVLSCSISGTFTSLRWLKYTPTSWIELTNDMKYDNAETLNITIRNVDVTDSREYLCQSSNGYERIQLNVFVYATQGSTVVWECPFSASNYTWQKFIQGNWTKLSENSKYSNALTSLITIRNVDVTDSGQYRCYVTDSAWDRIFLNVIEPSKSAILVGPIAGGVSGGILAVGLVVVVFFIYNKRNGATGTQNHDYDTRDNTKFDLHLYDETPRSISSDNKSPASVDIPTEQISSENDVYTIFTMYDARDFMRVLQNESSLSRHVRNEYQALNSMPILNATCDYEIADIKSGTISFEEYSNKALIKQQDNGNGYMITTVTDQSDNDNFWTMITNYHVGCIILLLHEMEKIPAFFPNTDEPIDTHKFKVEVSFFEKFQTNILEFVLDIWNKEEKTVVKVKLYKTTDWKIGDEHPPIDTMCKLLNILSSNESDMVTLLGSNDIGFRVCGELAACHEVLHAINNKKVFNLLQIAVDLKNIRPNLFQTCEEYNLCYKVIGYFLQNEHTYEVIDKKI